MKLSQIDLNLFVVFDVIYTEQNLTRAADILHITQPAVSSALNRLRDTLNDPLFVRTARGVRPTPVAHNLIDTVRAGLRQFDNCLQRQDNFHPATSNRVFRISVTDVAEQIFVPPLARLLARSGANLSLRAAFSDRRDTPLAMAAGNLDVAIDAPLLNHPELNSVRLRSDEYVCVMRRDHPRAQQPLSLENYLALEHIHISSRVRGAGHVDIALRALGVQRRIALRLQHYVAAPAVAAGTDYALSAPRRLAENWDLAVLPLPFSAQTLDSMLYWHKSAENDPANVWLREQLIGIGLDQCGAAVR